MPMSYTHLFQEAISDSLSTPAAQIVPVSAVEAFSVDRLRELTPDQVMDRLRQFHDITAFELEVEHVRNG